MCPTLYFNATNTTYEEQIGESQVSIADRHINFTNTFGIKTTNLDYKLEMPTIYCTPKLHKNPIKFRFITGAYHSSLEPLSNVLPRVLSH